MPRAIGPFWHWIALGAALGFPAAALAQDTAPLSVIDWLDSPAPLAALPHAPAANPPRKRVHTDEPAVAVTGSAPAITTRSLDAPMPQAVGIVPFSVTGMRSDLWAGSEVDTVIAALESLPDLELPAANALLFTLLLTETAAPAGAGDAQDRRTRARVDKLMALGAVDPALALIEQAGAPRVPLLFDAWMSLSLLVGTEDTACTALEQAPNLTQDIATKVFCAARSGDWATAALTFDTAQALSLLPAHKLAILDRFLHPDAFEDAGPLPVPRQMDPLTFRLFETIGEALPTGPLQRAYAVADLRDVAGWKSQLEAAERLTQGGALPDNRLLGLYTNRQPAASGRIWDRVRAVQRFDTALRTGNAEAVAKTLLPAWRQIREGGLEVTFANLFHTRLSEIPLTGRPAQIQQTFGLLSPAYEATARTMDTPESLRPEEALLRGVATGDVAGPAPKAAIPRAVYDAFTTPVPNIQSVEMAKNQRLGEALVATLDTLRDGARGDQRALREALSSLRALGLEDTARRAALQVLLLEGDL